MGQKDKAERLLLDINEIFADIMNVLLFKNKDLIKSEDLERANIKAQYKAADSKLREDERDITKLWKGQNVYFALFGMEGQTQADKTMPIRVISYDGAAYRQQLLEKVSNYYPVITIVLYFGLKHWCEVTSLHEMLDIRPELKEYVNDYHVNIFEVAWLTDEQLAMFKSDFGIVAKFFVEMRKNPNYVPDDVRIMKYPVQVMNLLHVFTRDERYEQIKVELLEEEKEDISMCTVADHLEKIGIKKGRKEGREEGREEGLELGLMALVSSLRKNTKDFNELCASIRDNEVYANVSDEDIKKYL